MDPILVTKALVAFAPALLLLFVFDRLDVFNLINAWSIVLLLLAGAALAALSFFANLSVMDGFPIGLSPYSRYVAPVIEEIMKAVPIAALYFFNRIGFKLDAVIAGFAVGAGFATAENIWYLINLPGANVSAWIVRGFGTAIMHGGATALFAVISHEMTERQAEAKADAYRFDPTLFAPGLLAAMLVHSAFNHFPDQPVAVMAAALLLIPATLFLALARSERATRHWLKNDQASHQQLLDDIRSGRFADTQRGQQLRALAAKLPAAAAKELSEYMELKLELVLRSEELLLASQTDTPAVTIADTDTKKFARLAELDRRLGRSASAAVNAQLGLSRNDLWELGRARERVAQRD